MIVRNIKFNEAAHTYVDELGNSYLSVTQLLGKLVPEFNKRFWLAYKALEEPGKRMRADVFNNKIIINNIPYDVDFLYKNPDVIKKIQAIDNSWKETTEEACARGNAEHNYLEDSINGFSKGKGISFNDLVADKGFKYKLINKEELDISPLKETHPFIYQKLLSFVQRGFIIFAEKRVYTAESLVAGTIDVFIVNLQTKEFYILDWKTNKREMKFISGYFKKEWIGGVKVETDNFVVKDERLLYPCEHLQKCKGIEYTLQLSMYAHLCELWGFKCLGIELVHLIPGKIIPPIYPIQFLKQECIEILEWKRNNFKKPKVSFGIG